MRISKHQLSLCFLFLTLLMVSTITSLKAQNQVSQIGPDKVTFANNTFFGENGRVFLSTSSGLYFSEGGESWRKVNEEFNNIYFNDLKFTKGKNGRVYVWNREQLWYTTDNGETWTNWFIYFEPAPFSHVNSMVVQGDTVFQALKGGLSYAVNNNVLAIPFPTLNGKNIVRVVVNGNSILAIGSDSKTYLSTDRGLTWNSNTDFPFSTGGEPIRSFDSKGAILIAADNFVIWFSADFGKTWTVKTSGLSINPQIYLGDVVIDGNDVFTIAHPTLYKSSLDASGLWESLFTYTGQSPRYISIQGDKIILSGLETLMKSVDRGLTWPTQSLEGIHDYRFEYLHSGNQDGSIIAYGGSGMYKKRTDEKKFSSFLPIYNQVVFEGDVIYSGGPIILTRSAIDGSTLNTSPIIPNTFVFSSGDEVYHGKDAFFSLLPSKGIWKLNNQNEWQEFNLGLPPNTVSDLKGNDNYVFTILNNSDLYRSPDSSPNWVKIDLGANFGLSKYLVNGSMILAGGVSSDIQLSKDNGNSWNKIGAINPNEGGVSALYMDSEYIMATTYIGEYLYASKDLGVNWTKVSIKNPLKYSLFVQSMTIANDSVYLGTNGNGILSFAKSSLTKTNQTILFGSVADKTFGDPSFTLSATASSALPVEYSTASDKISINGNQVTLVKPGTADITASQSGNDAFAAADPVTQTFCVNPPKPAIVVSAASSGSVLLVSNASVGNQWYKDGAVINSSTTDRITVTEDGVYTVKVTVDNCSSQLSDERAIVIPVAQTIVFGSLADKTLGDPSFTLAATASSALPVEYSTTSDKISINGNQVTLIKPGTTNITASQPGNNAFLAADPVSQTFCVNPPKPTIVVSNVSSGSVLLVSNASQGNQWYKNGAVINSATADRITVTEAGIYSVKVTVDNCSSQLSDEQPTVITGDLSPGPTATNLVYPNPVKQNITVNLHAFDLNHDVEIIIYDAIGNLKVRTIERGHESTTVSVDDFPTGLYIIKARQQGLSQTEKFLKD